MPEVRVGIVSWNTAGHLRTCLEALPAALDGTDADIVVVDNASADESVAIAEKFDVRVVRNLENRGYARAMNQALAGSDADVLVALHPDAIPSPGSLRALVQLLRDRPDVALVAPLLRTPDGHVSHSANRAPSLRLAAITALLPESLRRGRVGARWLLDEASGALTTGVVDVDWVAGVVHVIRAATLGGRPPYSERWFMFVEDLDLCTRLRAAGHRVVLDADVTVTNSGASTTRRAWGERRDVRRLDALSDWYAREHGAFAARVWAAINLMGTFVGRGVREEPDAVSERDRSRARRRIRRLHLRKLLLGTRLAPSAGEPPSERSRRVLAVVPGAQVSGAEMVLLRDLTAARNEGWTVRCACSDGPLVEELVDAGIAHLPIPDLRLPSGPKPIAYARIVTRMLVAARRLRRSVRRDEIVVANGVNVLPALRIARPNGRTLFFAHDVLVRRDRLALARFGAAAVDVAVAVSDAVAAPLRAAGMATTVVHNGTRWPVEPAPATAPSPPVIGCTAVLTEWKGLHVLLEAMTRLSRSDARLELVGSALPKDGAYAASLEARVAAPDLAGRVQFVGTVSDPLVSLRTWSVAVSASIDPEAGPLTALEAMSVGVPFVATDHGGVTEILGDAGLLVPPGDADALAAAIDRLLTDDALRARCRAAGPRNIVERGLTLDDQRRALLAVLTELAPRH